MKKRNAGFTLIELLVVISIISVLASILLPVFATAREKGRQSVCLSNIRQIGMSITIGMISDDQYPAPDGFMKTGGIYVCPSDPQGKQVGRSYEMNGLLIGQSEAIVQETSDTVLMLEAPYRQGIFEVGDAPPSTAIPVFSPEYAADSIPNPMRASHIGMADVLFADGHVKSKRYGQLTVEMFYPSGRTQY